MNVVYEKLDDYKTTIFTLNSIHMLSFVNFGSVNDFIQKYLSFSYDDLKESQVFTDPFFKWSLTIIRKHDTKMFYQIMFVDRDKNEVTYND